MDRIDGSFVMLATGLGALALARLSYRLVANMAFFLRHSGVQRYLQLDPGEISRDKESWALITGSGSGLGRALAFELAGGGFNIILHGSNEAKLSAVQKGLQAAYPSRSIRTLLLDARICTLLSGPDLAAKLDEVAQSLQDIQLRILINNVGMPQARPELRPPFDSIDTFTYDELKENASGNAIFPLLLTRALYPQLVHNQPALIVNTGSFAAMGSPLFPSYGPAKAFHMTSAAELRLENRIEGRDIEVLGIDVLGFTGSDTIKVKPSLLIPDAATYAKAVVRSIGCGYPHVAPYLSHALFFWTLDLLPLWVRERVLVNMMKTMRQEAADKFKTSTLNESQKKTL
jgi:17beta-estradiol 17-dehydrogenase / very-long-chain 3-oxoacyl-CoA reductase